MMKIFNIKKMYIEDNLSVREIAEKIGMSRWFVRCRLKELGVPSRSKSEGIKLKFKMGTMSRKGSNHNNWKGGKEIFQRKIAWKVKPKKQCENCGSKKTLDVHHKNKDITDNRIENLQVLCRSCHQKVEPRNINHDSNGKFVKKLEGLNV